MCADVLDQRCQHLVLQVQEQGAREEDQDRGPLPRHVQVSTSKYRGTQYLEKGRLLLLSPRTFRNLFILLL